MKFMLVVSYILVAMLTTVCALMWVRIDAISEELGLLRSLTFALAQDAQPRPQAPPDSSRIRLRVPAEVSQ